MICNDCPRQCNIDRSSQKGYCNSYDRIKLARAALHMWEEPCISGENGSGAIFFSGCNMQCAFCQNKEIAHGDTGKEVSVERLAQIMLELQEKKANNINLVTPSHYVNQIIDALDIAKREGLVIPIVYNSSSYERVETLKRLEGYVDVYLPDCKYYDDKLARDLSKATNYFDTAWQAIAQMYQQVGPCSFDEKGMIKSGVIVRHLVLPGHISDSKQIIGRLYKEYGDDVYLSIMSQYTPLREVEGYPGLSRKLSRREYDKILDYAIELGVQNAFMQELCVASESFIPEFDCEGV